MTPAKQVLLLTLKALRAQWVDLLAETDGDAESGLIKDHIQKLDKLIRELEASP